MRIVVNNIAASTGGAMSVLKDFYDYLINNEQTKNHEWIFLLSDNHIQEKKNIKVIILKEQKKWVNKLIFDYISGRKIISNLRPDIVFSMQNTVTYGVKCPQIVYVHQSLPFQTIKRFSFFKSQEIKLAVYQYLIGKIIRDSIKAAQLVVVQTNWMKEAIINNAKISKDKILVAFPSIKNLKRMKTPNVFNNCSFFYPANNSIYKNHGCLKEAIKILLNQNINDFQVILTIESDLNLNVIKNKGYMNFEDVLKQYNISTLIFPSYIETVGLPLVEARQVGGLILVADTLFAREVLSGYENAYYFNPFNAEELADLMVKVINNEISIKNIEQIEDNTDTHSSWDYVYQGIMEFGSKKTKQEGIK